MRGLLFARVNFSKPENGGIYLKCQGQLEALRKVFKNVDFLFFLSDGLYLNEKKIFHIAPNKINNRRFLAKLYMLDLGKIISNSCDLSNYDFLYLRYCLSSNGLLHFLHSFKKINPNSKVIVEFPTFPYKQEYQSFAKKIELKFDQLYRRKVFHLVDRAAHLGEESKIYKTPVLPIGNGINVDDFPMASGSTDWNELRLIAVGNFNYWHGLDRMLQGIHQYKGSKSVLVRIIGQGWENIHQLAIDLKIDSKISFSRPLSKTQLDDHFAWANFGIGTLGIHRKGVKINQSLKHREYAARGINFVYAGKDPGFIEACSGIINVNEAEASIDINNLVENLQNNTNKIKEHAQSHITWELQFKNIIHYIKGEKD